MAKVEVDILSREILYRPLVSLIFPPIHRHQSCNSSTTLVSLTTILGVARSCKEMSWARDATAVLPVCYRCAQSARCYIMLYVFIIVDLSRWLENKDERIAFDR
jgi:hypothetical protein